MDTHSSEFQESKMGRLAAGLNWAILIIFGPSNQKLITEGLGLVHRLLIISISVQSKIQTPQVKNIETIAFGIIAMMKISKGILKEKKPLVVQGSSLLVVLVVAIFCRRHYKEQRGRGSSVFQDVIIHQNSLTIISSSS